MSLSRNIAFHRCATAIWCTLILTACSSDSTQSGSWYNFEGNVLTVQKAEGVYLISALDDNMVKVDYSSDGTPGDVHAPVMDEPVDVRLQAKRNSLTLSTNRLRIEVTRDPVRVTFKDLQSRVEISEANGYVVDGDSTRLSFQLEEGERIYGTGSRALPMDRRGYRFLSYNAPHYGYEEGAANLNYAIPHIISSREYMLLIDNPARAIFDIGVSDPDVLEFSSPEGNHTYYLITGESHYELTRSYVELTGSQPLPPQWAFGNLQSRFGYRSQRETERVVRDMQRAGYPLDAIIIDLFWFSEDPQDGRIGNLTWDARRWPDPDGMMADLQTKGVRTITISEPFFGKESMHFEYLSEQGLLATDSSGQTMTIPEFYFADAGLLDLFKPEARDWLWDQYQREKERGVAGWWCDLGEPEKHPPGMMHVAGPSNAVHGLYGHEWTRVFYENYINEYVDERPLVLGRAGYAGTQRYGIIPWSGDVGRTWSGLRAQIPIMLSMSLSGLAYMHSDAGGFSLGERDAELYTRWMQFATFTPIFRPHGDAGVAPPEPVYWDKSVQEVVKPYIDLRYRMLPYIYTMAWRNSEEGLPMTRPLFYDWNWDSKTDSIEHVYLWGSDMLVAPVLHPGDTSVPVYLPYGNWIDFWTHEYHEGPKAIDVPVDLAKIPVFVLAGSIIPTIDQITNTSDYTSQELNLTYYYDYRLRRSQSLLYMDDGVTRDSYRRGAYHLLEMGADPNRDNLELDLKLIGKGYPGAPSNRNLHFELINIPRTPGDLLIDSVATEYAWDTTTRVLTFDMAFEAQAEIVLEFVEDD